MQYTNKSQSNAFNVMNWHFRKSRLHLTRVYYCLQPCIVYVLYLLYNNKVNMLV
jgi:hypothetical protein